MTGSRPRMVLEEPRSLDVPGTSRCPKPAWTTVCCASRPAALCGTDHEQYTGHIRAGFPFVPGHEVVGVIEELGRSAAERWHVDVGDRVAVEVFLSLQNLRGVHRRPLSAIASITACGDMYGFVDVEQGARTAGVATPRIVYLAPDAMCCRFLPDSIRYTRPCSIRSAPASDGPRPCQARARRHRRRARPGVRGLSACAAAKDAGAELVLVTGYGPRDAGRLEISAPLRSGRHRRCRCREPGQGLARRATDGRLADVVVDVTAKAPGRLGQGVGLAPVLAARSCSREPAARDRRRASPDHVVYKELHLSVRSGGRERVPQTRSTCSRPVVGRSQNCPAKCVGLDEVESRAH